MSLSGVRLTAVAVVILLALSVGCGDDNDSGSTPAPTRPASPALLPAEAISAVGDYIRDSGLNGQVFELTEPAGCEEIQEEERAATTNEEREQIIEKTTGKLCVNQGASLMREDRALATLQDYVSGAGWVVGLELVDGIWSVTDVQALGFSENE